MRNFAVMSKKGRRILFVDFSRWVRYFSNILMQIAHVVRSSHSLNKKG